MQAHSGSAKKYGHNRRPSYGKVTPISSLLLDLSGSSPGNFDSLSRDGVSPDASRQTILFSLGAQFHNNERSDGDTLFNMADMTTSFIEQEKSIENTEKIKPPFEEEFSKAFLKCVNYHHNENNGGIVNVEIDNNDSNRIDLVLAGGDKYQNKPCQICNVDKNVSKNTDNITNDTVKPLVELCEVLCDENCKTSISTVLAPEHELAKNDVDQENAPFSSSKTFARSNSSRQEFLASMLDEAMTLNTPTIVEHSIDESAENTLDHIVPLTVENVKEFNDHYFRDKLAIAEALAQTSMMTSPAVRRRLAARKIEMSINNADFVYDTDSDYIPPRELLMYLLR